MTNLNEKIMSIYKKRKIQRFYNLCVSMLCILTAIGVLSSLVEPALSATWKADNSWAPDDSGEVDLLVGDNQAIKGGNVSETIENANNTYLLGIASQFSVFLESDFTSIASDCEGRLAVGGNIETYGYNYNVGLGNYESPNEPLEDLLGIGNRFAVAIVGGSASRISRTWNIVDRIVVGNYCTVDGDFEGNYWNGSDYYQTDGLIDFASTFYMLRVRSSILANSAKKFADDNSDKNESATTVTYNGNTVTFDGKNRQKDGTVMFNMPNWIDTNDKVTFNFINIPDGVNIVINCDDGGLTFSNTGFDTSISTGSTINDSDYISKDKTGHNNDSRCARLLWNFSKATNITLGGNFQGTILAPNAYVTDQLYQAGGNDREANGHLSGALIAESFEGTTEFGYRPYQGPVDMLELPNKYYINVDKVDNKNQLLSNAEMVMQEKQITKQDDGTTKEEWVDYTTWTSGQTSQKIEVKPGVEYKIFEKKAPEGYIQSKEERIVKVTEHNSVTKDIVIGGGYKEPAYNINSIGWKDSNFNNYDTIKMRFTYKENNGKFFQQEIDLKQITQKDDWWWNIDQANEIPSEVYKVELYAQKNPNGGYDPQLDIDGNKNYIWDTQGSWQVFNSMDKSIPTSSIPVNCITTADVTIDGTTTTVDFENELHLTLDSNYELNIPEIDLTDKNLNTVKPNNPTITNTPEPKGANLMIQKVDKDGTTLLTGAEIGLYTNENVKLATYSDLGAKGLSEGTKTNDFDSYVKDGKLQEGSYYLKETKAPDGYLIEENKLQFTVNNNGEILDKENKPVAKDGEVYILKFKNTPISKGKMVIKKEWQKYDGTTDDSQTQDITVKVYRTTEKLTNGGTVSKPVDDSKLYTTVTLKKDNEYTEVLYPDLTDSNGNKYYYYVVEDVPAKYEDSYEIRRWQNHGIADIGLNNIADGYKADPDPNSLKNRDNTATYTKYTGKYAVCQLVEYDADREDSSVKKQNENKPTKFIIRNKSTEVPIEMPETGGTGTTKFFALGTIMIAGGGLYLVSKNKIKRLVK